MSTQWPETSDDFPTPAKEFFARHLAEVVNPVMAVLEKLVSVELPLHCRNRVQPSTYCYKDDGETRCPGTEYSKYYFVPIGREYGDPHSEWSSSYNGSASQLLVFNAEINLRDEDQKKKSTSTEVRIAPFVADFSVRNTFERITYGPYIAPVDTRKLARLLKLISETLEMSVIHEKVEETIKQLT